MRLCSIEFGGAALDLARAAISLSSDDRILIELAPAGWD